MHPRNSVKAPFARTPLVALVAATLFGGASALAEESARSGSVASLLEEVIVTARKREEGAQEVPLSITAYNSDQIETLKIRDLFGLSTGMPNVVLDDVGTTRGTANFSIRGLGINSSIPGIDPTVGLFINGVYIGNNVGVVFDSFDLESIEVLRGPQGILFGRNVTGGAILMNTRTPGDELNATFKAAVDTGEDGGWNRYLMGAVGGPVTDNFGARLTLYYNDDQGWFENDFNGQNVGAVEQLVARPTVTWTPTDTLDLILRYERTDIEGDGPVAQSHRNGSGVDPAQFEPLGCSIPDRNSFDLCYDEVGSQDTESDFLTLQADQAVDLGDGTITAIFGWRQSEGESRGDIDGQPVWLFHAPSALETEQSSVEVRYTGTFDERATFTTGFYYFENEINYDENRELAGLLTGGVAPFATFHGGGNLDVETYGLFTALDYDLTDTLTLNAGIRFSYEEKQVEVATLPPSQDMPCSVLSGTCTLDFMDKADWDSWAPKLGATFHISDDARIYAHWTRGFRSGGYNMRNTSTEPADTPGPFDEEQVDNYEIGYKSTFGRGKLNAAVFYNEVSDMQRELNKPGPIGVIQLIQNTADAEILGIEVDATYAILDNLLMFASVGYIDAEYSDVNVDLNEDGVVNSADEDLDLPRAPELTYSVGFSLDLDVGDWGYASSRVNYAYRDETAYTDSNLGYILEQEILDAGIDLRSNDGQWTFSIYGKNLLDEVKHGGDTQLPADLRGVVPWGGTFSPLSKGRHYGAEVVYNF